MAKKENNKVRHIRPRVEGELLRKEGDDPLDSWRIFKIMSEFVEGFEMIRKYKKAVTFFGSARCGLDDEIYEEANKLSRLLSKDGFAVITGGGPGIMEAANSGAFQAGGKSVGLNIEMPIGEGHNTAVHDSFNFHYFFTRKVMLTFASEAYIYFPGGFGTLDELFELMTLVKTGKIRHIPIILYGKEFWSPLLKWFDESLLIKHQTISESDTKIYTLVDSVEEAHEVISKKVYEYCSKDGAC